MVRKLRAPSSLTLMILGDKIYEEDNETKSSTQQNEESINLAHSSVGSTAEFDDKVNSRPVSALNKENNTQDSDFRITTALRRIEQKYAHSNKFGLSNLRNKSPLFQLKSNLRDLEFERSRVFKKQGNTSITSGNKKFHNSGYDILENKKKKTRDSISNNSDTEILLKLMEEERRKTEKNRKQDSNEFGYFRHTFGTKWNQDPYGSYKLPQEPKEGIRASSKDSRGNSKKKRVKRGELFMRASRETFYRK